jgi:hypothetical protein
VTLLSGIIAAALSAATAASAWTVERSVSSSRPCILTWEFFQSPGDGRWDSVEIRLALKPGLAVASRVISWPQSGPWAGAPPRLDGDSGAVRIKAWSSGNAEGAANGSAPVPIATLSLELQSETDLGFGDVEAGLDVRRFAAEAAVARVLPKTIEAGARAQGLRDALGRYQAILKWRSTAETMRGEAFPSP